MSDQGDAGQWRPASNDQNSAPDETTGPIPAVSGDEAPVQGFPPPDGEPEAWSAGEGESSTGGFPGTPPAEAPSSGERAPFEPAESAAPGSTAPYGAESPEAGAQETGGFDFGRFDETPYGENAAHEDKPYEGTPYEPGSFDTPSYGTASFDPGSHDGSEGFSTKVLGEQGESGSPLEDRPYGEQSYGEAPHDPQPFETKPFEAPSYEDKPYENSSYEDRPHEAPESPYGTPPPAAEQGPGGQWVTAEEQAAENEFFAPDDHPPMWDKVVAPSGPPPQPGKPSSGNLRLPDWMRDEQAEAARAGDSSEFDDDSASKRGLYAGFALLVAGLLAVGGVYVLKGGGGTESASHTSAPTHPAKTPPRKQSKPQPEKPLAQFRGQHSTAIGRVVDSRSGLSYPRLSRPWSLPAAGSPMSELGFSMSQFAVTEKAGGQPTRWARLMSTQLSGAEKAAYGGPGTERAAATQAATTYEARLYGFRHKRKVLASQPLDIAGHKGWLVGYYLTYRRAGTAATGDILTVAVVDTGKPAPGVLVMSVPNNKRRLWPDLDFVIHSLQVG